MAQLLSLIFTGVVLCASYLAFKAFETWLSGPWTERMHQQREERLRHVAGVFASEIAEKTSDSDHAAGRKCPECAETVQADARICRFCRHQFA